MTLLIELLKMGDDDWVYFFGVVGFVCLVLWVFYMIFAPSVEEESEMIRNDQKLPKTSWRQ